LSQELGHKLSAFSTSYPTFPAERDPIDQTVGLRKLCVDLAQINDSITHTLSASIVPSNLNNFHVWNETEVNHFWDQIPLATYRKKDERNAVNI
jgi:hypothetical protein